MTFEVHASDDIPTGEAAAAPVVTSSSATSPLLRVRDLSVRFGGIVALDGIGFDIRAGDIVGLIGPNGAGKTTLFNCLSRLYRPTSGDVLFEGASILKVRRHDIPRLGIGRTFQNVALFDHLSVEDNVLVGGHVAGRVGFFASALRLPGVAEEEARLRGEATEAMAFMGITEVRDRPAGDLPFPIRKRVELARALMSRPRLLLLDEPAAGLNHQEVEVLEAQIRRIRGERGMTILVVEHHMNLVMSISDQVVAIDFGRMIADGPPNVVRTDPAVIRAYLGSDA